MIDAFAGGALMNKTPVEAWELIKSVADNHQCFKTRATSSVRGMYEIAPSDTTVLAKSLADITSMLREMKESQQATPKLLTQPSQSSPLPQAPPKHCGICSFFRLSQQENKEMREVAKRTEAQISHLTDLMTKFANQMLPSTSTPPPPPNPSPVPSQPLPNLKGGINVVEKGDEKKEKKNAITEWLIELIVKANAMVEFDDENWWD
ncbi:hypothetical protein PIB30_012414 [Stylosanthes scabra]|uniref:Uncharacterized protein n=1 Tax=Stylosanthes scabra TaxID=79078 RepID=A0ABU6R5X8_9FABA|nr:hypothetical protein [Stylosanthes scabra]